MMSATSSVRATPLIEIDSEALELIALIAGADADDEPTVAHQIDEADLLDHADRIVERKDEHRGAEPDLAA